MNPHYHTDKRSSSSTYSGSAASSLSSTHEAQNWHQQQQQQARLANGLANTGSLLLKRPLSLSNLLQSHNPTATPSAPYNKPQLANGAFPTSSNSAPIIPPCPSQQSSSSSSFAAQQYTSGSSDLVHSPTGSVQSFGSTSTGSTVNVNATSLGFANKVILPTNEHGVRQRINIVPATRLASGGSRPSSTLSTLLLSHHNNHHYAEGESESVAGTADQKRKKKNRQSNLSLLSTASSANSSHYHSRGVFQDNMTNHSLRSVSEGATMLFKPGSRSASPAPVLDIRTATSNYSFPAKSQAQTQKYNMHPSFDPAESSSPDPRTPQKHAHTYHGQTFSESSLASSSSTNLTHSPSFGSDSMYHTTPASSKPSPHSASSSASFTQTSRMHLPIALLPGGYDFSPTPSNNTLVSRETYETASAGDRSYDRSDSPAPRNISQQHQHQPSQDAANFAYMRDRSASVPRTVSDFGSSGRTSEADDESTASSRPALPSSSNGVHHQSQSSSLSGHSIKADLNRQQRQEPPRSESRLRKSEHSGDDTEEEDVAPLVSPIPPKLDMDFGMASFSLDIDFGESFTSDKLSAGLSSSDAGNSARGGGFLSSFSSSSPFTTSRSAPDFLSQSFDPTPTRSVPPVASTSALAPKPLIKQEAPKRQDSAPEVRTASGQYDLGLGWGFPSTKRISQTQTNSEQQPSTNADPTPSLLSASTLKGSDTDTTPKASMSPSAVSSDTSFKPLQQLKQSSPLQQLSFAAGSIAKEDHSAESMRDALQAGLHSRSSSAASSLGNQGTFEDKLNKLQQRSDTPLSFTSSQFSRPASSLLDASGSRQLNADTREGESKRTTMSSGEHQSQNQTGKAAAQKLRPNFTNNNNLNSARLSMNKNLPPVPPQESAEPGPSSSDTSKPSLLQLRLQDKQSAEAAALGRPAPHRTRSDSSASPNSTASAARPFQQQHIGGRDGTQPPSVHTRSRSSTLERQLPQQTDLSSGQAFRGHHGSSASAHGKLEMVDTGNSSKPAAPLHPQVNKKHLHPNGELIKKDPATEKLLTSAATQLATWLERHQSRAVDAATLAKRSRSPDADIDASTSSAADLSRDDDSANTSYDASTTTTMAASLVSALKAIPSRVSTAQLLNRAADSGKATTDAKSPSGVHAPSSSVSGADSGLKRIISPQQAGTADTTANASKIELTAQSTGRAPALSLKLEAPQPLRIHAKKPSIPVEPKPAARLKAGGELPFSAAWQEIETAYKALLDGLKTQDPDRAQHIQTVFLPKFRQEELGALLQESKLSDRQQNLLFDWVDALFEDLQGTPANRGACLDGIAMVIESRLMVQVALTSSKEGKAASRMERTVATLLNWAIEKLNGKAIFANTLGFAGKMLAAAFWLLEGVGHKLLRLLPAVKRQHMVRLVAEAGTQECPGIFPPHLTNLSFSGNMAAYVKLFPPVKATQDADNSLYTAKFKQSPKTPSSAVDSVEDDIDIEMTGNWLIRWTATDSDLPFAFMRAYHRQLSNHLPLYEEGLRPLTTAQLIKAPGYLYIASALLEVCDALIHRNLRSVTTMAPSNSSVNANESANLAAGQKPKALEVVSKRVVQTIFEVVGGSLQAGSISTSPLAFASAALRHNFGCSLATWIAATTKKTSMYDTRGIFALLDLIEGLIYNVCAPPFEEDKEEEEEEWQPSEIGLALFDTKFILTFIKLILSKADNTTCLLRTISFLYTEFQTLTLRSADREFLCEQILLDAEVFNRLFLYYNVGVRGYFLRLLVYRLARLGNPEDNKNAIVRDPRIYYVLRIFEARLEKIRKRHDELDPLDDYSDEEDDFYLPRAKRSTICSTWGVHDKPWAMELRGLRSRRASSTISEGDEREAAVLEENAQVEAIQESPVQPVISPETPSADIPAKQNKKKLGAAKKVAGGWWNTLKNRKASGDKKKPGVENQIQPFYAGDSSAANSSSSLVPPPLTRGSSTSNLHDTTDRPPSPSYQSSPFPQKDSQDPKSAQSAGSPEPSEHRTTLSPESLAPPSQKKDGLRVEVPSPRLRKVSTSRKSIRRGTSTAASPRSRRSSMYSFDLDVDTPRSDAFDFPLSPASATSPASPSGVSSLSISPIAFNALMDGALSFSTAEDGSLTANPISPGHKRHKSTSSVRKSRPVSVASERNGPSPRVSKRFSKRSSILPPPALDLLKESPSEPVPKIPDQYRTPTSGNGLTNAFPSIPAITASPPYDLKYHPYAVRSLKEYEDCLDEWELFVVRAKEEEGLDGRELSALIPRLQCAWPSTWEE